MHSDKMLFCLNFVSILIIFICHTGLSQKVELPPQEFPKDNQTYQILNAPEKSETPPTPPLVFPENDPKIIENKTILQDLMSHATIKDQNQTKIDTEVPDLIVSVLDHENKNLTVSSTTQSAIVPTMVTTESTTERDLKMEQELIDSDVSKTEDVKMNVSSSVSRTAVHQDHDHLSRGSGPILQGQLAAVLAGVFAMIAVASYIGLLTWRRYLEHRYGNREMLINEEDPINYNDMKNFEL